MQDIVDGVGPAGSQLFSTCTREAVHRGRGFEELSSFIHSFIGKGVVRGMVSGKEQERIGERLPTARPNPTKLNPKGESRPSPTTWPRQPAIHGHSIRSCPSFLDIPTHNVQLDQLVEDAGRELGEVVVLEKPFHSEAKQPTNHHDPHTRSRSQPRRMMMMMTIRA